MGVDRSCYKIVNLSILYVIMQNDPMNGEK